jgi:hypothetical protein
VDQDVDLAELLHRCLGGLMSASRRRGGGLRYRSGHIERQIYGQRSERSSRLIEQLALTFEELESDRD